jgi:murein DD-endopeptidase MepM/ murein hydrolase activator NlpD
MCRVFREKAAEMPLSCVASETFAEAGVRAGVRSPFIIAAMASAFRVWPVLLLTASLPLVAAPDDALHVTHRTRALAPGEVVALTVTAPAAITAVESTWRDRPVVFVRRGATSWHALIGIDVEEVPGPRSLSVVARRPGAEDLTALHAFVVEPKQWRTRRLKVARRFVTPPVSALPRIKEEAALLNALFDVARPQRSWSGAFVRPVEGVAVSGFGVRSVLNGQPRGPHNGADFAAGTGTPIHAPGAGVVAFARPFYYSGNTVIVDHGFGLYSTMAHLSAFDVEEGARVERGTLLGKVGATGRVTGPHLHWSVRLLGARIDPESLLVATE